ncbi:RNA dependent RNA polymerase-domain-containing protein [Lactarius quietus]|nr:RNA dependent RNA polymerase-domain-containing protein [Lactarius quietus]
MEIDLNWIGHDANVYDVRKSVELVLHGPDLYDPNDGENNGRKPNFQVVMGQPESAGRLHNGTATLHVPTERAFSIEYEREVPHSHAAYITIVYERSLIWIDIGRRETEENNFFILVKFSSIRKLGIGYDELRQPFIIFDLFTPPNFEKQTFNRAPRDRISTLDDAHAAIAPYAHHLRIVLSDHDDLLRFEKVCQVAECEPRPIRIARVDALAKNFFSCHELDHIQHWIDTMDWKSAFQIEAYLRCGLLNTHDLLRILQQPIDDVIRDYDEDPKDCLARVRMKHPTLKPLRLTQGLISCHYVIITPSRILLEGPYTTQSNRVIRRYLRHDPALVERFIRVEFRDEDHLSYRWGDNVDGSSFLQHHVGGVLRYGFTIGGRSFEFLAYSTSSLREHSFWFVNPFRDPEEGSVTADKIRASLGDFSKLLRTPSMYGARIAQAFTATYPSVKIRRDQWEEQPELGVHTDGVGTISPELAAMIWEAKRNTSGNSDRIEPSAYQFRFLGYKGVVVVDHRLKGIKMRLRQSQLKFLALNNEVAEFEIARAFDCPFPAYLNRPIVMVLEDRGVSKETFIDLLDKTKEKIYLSSESLENFTEQLRAILNKLGLDFKHGTNKTAIGRPFYERLLRYSMTHLLREFKFKAHIPIPKSYQLVGVADEGRAYIEAGLKEEDVFTLKPGSIYACVQESAHEEPVFLKGACLISRSPAIHPGDVQRVYAVGEPPKDKICFFRGLKNVVVHPAVGDRSLASCLAGGDLDGDTYDIYYGIPALFPTVQAEPAYLSDFIRWSLREDEPDATVNDICKFIVEYMYSDALSMLADRHITIADQSKDGVFDDRCMRLAAMCSKAVDYVKSGVPVGIYNKLPSPLFNLKPDWSKSEVSSAREQEFYESDRALGYMFRSITLRDPSEPIDGFSTAPLGPIAPLEDPISRALSPLVQNTLNANTTSTTTAAAAAADIPQPEELHACYAGEMRYICVTHTLVDAPEVRLEEEEVVLGTILATTTQPRWRTDRAFRMRLHSEALVRDIRSQIVRMAKEDEPTEEELRLGLSIGWEIWCWAQHHRDDKEFIESLSLIALGVVLDCLMRLGALTKA